MKSVLQAGWLLTVAVGNIIVLIVAEAGSLPDQVYHYFFFIYYKILVKSHFCQHPCCYELMGMYVSFQWAEYLLFASLLVAVSVIFAIMAYFYTYMDPTEIEAQFMELEPEDKKKKGLEMTTKDNAAYVHSENADVKQTKI